MDVTLQVITSGADESDQHEELSEVSIVWGRDAQVQSTWGHKTRNKLPSQRLHEKQLFIQWQHHIAVILRKGQNNS